MIEGPSDCYGTRFYTIEVQSVFLQLHKIRNFLSKFLQVFESALSPFIPHFRDKCREMRGDVLRRLANDVSQFGIHPKLLQLLHVLLHELLGCIASELVDHFVQELTIEIVPVATQNCKDGINTLSIDDG